VITDLPWEFAFSYSRALEDPVLDTWRGKVENVTAAQDALLKRLKLNSLADVGEYESTME
jgi:fructose-bisphosphate aldolase, class I